MDALALLCNLYGDGPATLKRLRSAGCDSFSALEDLEPDQLAEILGTNEAAARRFLREARLLVERVAEGELEHEERGLITMEPEPALPHRGPLAAGTDAPPEPAGAEPRSPARPESDGHPGPAGGQTAAFEGDRSSALIDRVLATWRERDAGLAAERGPVSAEPPEQVDSDDLAAEEDEEDEAAAGLPLSPRLVDGLDHTLCERLWAAGFATVEALSGSDALDVARASGIELTRILRLQFLARRLTSERSRVESPGLLRPVARPRSPARGAKFSASETPFGAAAGLLADDLDRADRRPPPAGSSPARSGSPEGPGGPFA